MAANLRIQPTGFASLRSARLRLMRVPLAGFSLSGEENGKRQNQD
jgi:hypothetical protein